MTRDRAIALAVLALAWWLSLTPTPPTAPGAPEGTDLLVHLAMHGGLALCLLRGWAGALPVALALAVALEAGQLLVPGRHFFAGDLAMNLSGAALGALAFALRDRRLAGPGAQAVGRDQRPDMGRDHPLHPPGR